MTNLHQESELLAHHISDKELVKHAISGDAIAFETIIRRHNQTLFRAAYSIIEDRSMVDDLLQEAYLKAFTHLESFQHQSTLKTWLTRIVVNTALNSRRAQKIREASSYDTVVDFNQYNEVDMSSATHGKKSQEPDSQVYREQIKIVIQLAIQKLPLHYRTVFILREVEQLSVAETADCLSLTQEAVKTRLLRAKAMLRDKLSRKLEPYLTDLFEFAGKNCDQLTENVLVELNKQGYLSNKN